ncbi:calmodulin [Acrasis kona]|uniref:Calmodulin n=1 Tax=Acrasis kona TaxID=1008807 RepID=A0AAW2Z9K7_9EUKA
MAHFISSGEKLSEEELAEFREIFNLVEGNGGGITRTELEVLLKTLGLNVSQENLNKVMDDIDTDGSGDIEFSEFVESMSKNIHTQYTSNQLRVAFSVFQTDDMPKGLIKTESLEKALTIWGSDRLSTDKANELIMTVNT